MSNTTHSTGGHAPPQDVAAMNGSVPIEVSKQEHPSTNGTVENPYPETTSVIAERLQGGADPDDDLDYSNISEVRCEFTAQELLELETNEQQELIEGLLPSEGVGFLVGIPGSGKST